MQDQIHPTIIGAVMTCKRAAQILTKNPLHLLPVAIILAVLSIVPGLGTFIAAFFSFCFPHASGSKCKGFFVNICAALLQVITAPIMVGWIWSCIWGMTMVQLARKEPTS
jgi:hypothetical protein